MPHWPGERRLVEMSAVSCGSSSGSSISTGCAYTGVRISDDDVEDVDDGDDDDEDADELKL